MALLDGELFKCFQARGVEHVRAREQDRWTGGWGLFVLLLEQPMVREGGDADWAIGGTPLDRLIMKSKPKTVEHHRMVK